MDSGFAVDLGKWFSENRIQVANHLDRYFTGKTGDKFSGRWFERLAAVGDPDCFEASDVLAVEALSVSVPPESAATLLLAGQDRFNALLKQIPSDQDLWDLDRSSVGPDSAAHDLHKALDDLPKVGWVTAGKLMAAKRPRVIPILDKEVRRLLRPSKNQFWLTMHDQLFDDDCRAVIQEVCANAPQEVSLLRRIDVALWMHATQSAKR